MSQLHSFIHQVVIFYVSKNAFQQPPAVLLQRFGMFVSTNMNFSLCIFWMSGGSETKTSLGNEGPTQNLMFTINVCDFIFVQPDFHCGCAGYISDIILSVFDHKLLD